jgi:hypothetical protein
MIIMKETENIHPSIHPSMPSGTSTRTRIVRKIYDTKDRDDLDGIESKK